MCNIIKISPEKKNFDKYFKQRFIICPFLFLELGRDVQLSLVMHMMDQTHSSSYI